MYLWQSHPVFKRRRLFISIGLKSVVAKKNDINCESWFACYVPFFDVCWVSQHYNLHEDWARLTRRWRNCRRLRFMLLFITAISFLFLCFLLPSVWKSSSSFYPFFLSFSISFFLPKWQNLKFENHCRESGNEEVMVFSPFLSSFSSFIRLGQYLGWCVLKLCLELTHLYKQTYKMIKAFALF